MAKLKKRANGQYRKDIYIGRDKNNKKKYKAVFGKTIQEVEQKAVELKIKLNKGYDLDLQNDTFGDWAERWLKAKKMEISHKRWTSYKGAVKYLNPLFDKKLDTIKTYQIQSIINDTPLAKSTLNNIKITASQIFDFAINNRAVDYNPVKTVKLPKDAPRAKRRALTKNEQSWFLDTPHRGQLPAMLVMFAGLRRGEIVPLTWSDIDLLDGTIRVDKSAAEVGNKFIVKSGAKTKAGVRTVYIPKILVLYLKNAKRTSIYVCPNAKGGYMTPSSWDRMWDSYMHVLNLKYSNEDKFTNSIQRITIHMLRHTFATMLYMSGVDVLTAKEQLGHSDVKTTLDIYTHLDGIYKKRTISKLDDYIDTVV